jgi:F-box protein 18 (helicase)
MEPTARIGTRPEFRLFTAEQQEIVKSPAKRLKVKAGAGTGKTSTVMGYAAARPLARGLYIVFGKANQSEAQRRLSAIGANCKARTTHSLAYEVFGKAFQAAGKLQGHAGGLRAATTANLLRIPSWDMAKAINQTVNNFMASPDQQIHERHLPDVADYPILKMHSGSCVDGARNLWALLTNLSNTVQVPPDVYLKQWVMTKPRLDYDYIIIDEAQDVNPLSAGLINAQEQCSRIYVGDEHQGIFAFRGAVNMMATLTADVDLELTASFRFNKLIGHLATVFLRHWKDSPFTVRGMAPWSKIEPTDQQAYLSRTVGGLIEKAVALNEKGAKIHWIGPRGFDDYRSDVITEAHQLFKGNTCNADNSPFQDATLRLVGSWENLKDKVEQGSADIGAVYRFVERYKDEVPRIMTELRDKQVLFTSPAGGGMFSSATPKNGESVPAEATHILTTAHRSKGLEFPVVHLLNDFPSLRDKQGRWLKPGKVSDEELNLLYVAMTRAKKGVAVSRELVEWFSEQPATSKFFPKQEERATESANASPIPTA